MADKDSPRFAAFKNLVQSISSDHKKLKITEEEMRDKLLFCVECSEVDYPKLVGSGGKNVNALEVLYAMAVWRGEAKDGVVHVSTPDTSKRAPRQLFKLNKEWKPADLMKVLNPILDVSFPACEVDVKEVNQETMVVRLWIDGFDGTTHSSNQRRCEPLSFDTVEQSLTRILRVVAKSNGRDVEVELNER
jgi:predicted RNA-binding protein YlqC (UPF0109 family)